MMRIGLATLRLMVCGALVTGGVARAETPDTGNDLATRTARASTLVRQALRDIRRLVAQLDDTALRRATADAVENPETCVRHRASLKPADERAIFDHLVAAHLAGPAQDIAGVFPPVRDAGSACPHLPQAFYASPGGDNAGHHRWPGGLPVHTAFNAHMGIALAREYDHQTGLHSDHSAVIAAALWHDWAKTLVFQWQADGREFAETRLGGQGVTDDFGQPGDSRTGAHHILGLAEAMSRGLSPVQVLIQACAHASPTGGHDWILVNWLHAAAIIARVDPVRRGYLVVDGQGRLVLPVPNPGSPITGQWRAECLINFQSDQNYVFAESAAVIADDVLAQLAGRFGYDPADGPRYRNSYRNVVLSRLGADHIQLQAQHGGLPAVAADLGRLRDAGAF